MEENTKGGHFNTIIMIYDIKTIKSKISCVDIAKKYNLGVQKSGDRCRSPFHAGKNSSSMVVYDDFWHSFSDGMGGDQVDLVAELAYHGDKKMAIQELAQMVGLPMQDDPPEFIQAKQELCDKIGLWHRKMLPEHYEYLARRGITRETADALRIGFNGDRIIIPIYKTNSNSYPVSYVGRAYRADIKPKYKNAVDGYYKDPIIFGLDSIPRAKNKELLYVTEGIFDALSIYQEKYAVLCTLGTPKHGDAMSVLLHVAGMFKKTIFAFDNDAAGKEFTNTLSEEFLRHRLRFDVARIETPYKDVSDFYADGNKIESLKLYDGYTFCAKQLKDKDKFKKYIRNVARFLPKEDVNQIFSEVQHEETFPAKWLKDVSAQVYKAPSDKEVVEEICRSKMLRYVPNVGFYEWTGNIWKKRIEEAIQSYVSEILCGFATGTKISSVIKVLKSDPKVLATDILFDRNPLMNFANGTLELETGLFREPDPNDYCTIQQKYPYIPSATCPAWEKFIDQITAEDERRKEILQYIPGYILFSNCPHEAVFVLMGDGSNGKSRYTMMLEEIFGAENCTNITPRGLTENFERIHLINSLVNIAGEIKSDISGSEEIIKQIASGETLQACYKGKDMVRFNSRAKLIFAMNGQLRSKDTSDGLTRRLVVINFPAKFVDNPNPANHLEYQKDIYLIDKLLKELPGIFNWVYKGYKGLIRDGGFVETNEQREFIEEYREQTNPIVAFNEWLAENSPWASTLEEITTSQMYRVYVDWCQENGHLPLSNTKFHPEFRRVSKEYVYKKVSRRVNGQPRWVRFYISAKREQEEIDNLDKWKYQRAY